MSESCASVREEWNNAPRSSQRFFVTADEVTALLASDACTERERAWFAAVTPVIRGA